MRKGLKRIISTVGVTAICATTAFAGTTYSKQNVTVAQLGGSGYSSLETKSTTGKSGNIMNPTVGGGYTVTAKMQDNDGNRGGGVSVSTKTGTLDIPSTSSHTAGEKIQIRFDNKVSTTVRVLVTAQMRCN